MDRERHEIPEEDVASAINAVLDKRMSVREAAKCYNLKPMTLQNRIKKHKNVLGTDAQGQHVFATPNQNAFSSKYATNQVFTCAQEVMLEEYLKICSQIHYGLTYKNIREFAYEYSKHLNSKIPKSWEERKCAGVDWMQGFMKRHSSLSKKTREHQSFTYD
ncbi:hypothetical protein ANN_04319 [Periplaneta americana]|uniref:HTH psq-type domain-containing protein n=1 Tax=Periplaneta americana TaxID=6978 RepID=A0ABQ8T9W1_PERAM|nr:hypothetical protein ANN_04319 [Periplaneta americana]